MSFSKTSLYAAALSAAVFVAAAGAAHADPVVLGMTNGVYNVETGATNSVPAGTPASYQSTYFSGGTTSNGQGWGQVLQNSITDNPYLTDAIVVNRVNANTLTITLQTTFSGNDSDTPVHYADLFITSPTSGSATTPNTNWSYGIGLGGQISGAAAGSGGQGLYSGGAAAGVYSLGGNTSQDFYTADQRTSDQIWSGTSGYYIGGDVAATSAVNAAEQGGGAVAGEFQPPTQINTSAAGVSLVSGLTESVTQTLGNNVGYNQILPSGDNYYDVTVTLTGASSLLDSMFTNFDIFWGTGDCDNDAIWGSVQNLGVPAPGALALLGLGLIGLVGFRRRVAQ